VDRIPTRHSLHAVIDASRHLDGAKAGHVQEYDQQAGTLTMVAHRGFSAEFVGHFRVARAGDGSAGGQVLSDRHRVLIRDTHTDAAYAPHVPAADADGIRAILALPLTLNVGEFVGAISMHYGQPHIPAPPVVQRFERLAHVAAQVIWCARARASLLAATPPDVPTPGLPPAAAQTAVLSRDILAKLPERNGINLIESAEHHLDLLIQQLRRMMGGPGLAGAS